jgi:hypothetical protein
MANDKDKEIIFQPYGKDEFYINLLASKDGEWLFGPSDKDKFNHLNQNSIVHSYLHIKGKNPKYHKILIDDGFELKTDPSRVLIKKDAKKPTNVNELYVFVVYNYEHSFLHLEYTPSYDEYVELKKNFNILSTFIIIGDELSVDAEKTGIGIGTRRQNVIELIEDLKKEKRELEDL